MKKEKRQATYNFFIQIGDSPEVNMNTLSKEEREEIGQKLYHNLVTGLGYREVSETKKTV